MNDGWVLGWERPPGSSAPDPGDLVELRVWDGLGNDLRHVVVLFLGCPDPAVATLGPFRSRRVVVMGPDGIEEFGWNEVFSWRLLSAASALGTGEGGP